ncbi:MAG: hypothetical protein ACI9SP_003266 [Arenicella sp.]
MKKKNIKLNRIKLRYATKRQARAAEKRVKKKVARSKLLERLVDPSYLAVPEYLKLYANRRGFNRRAVTSFFQQLRLVAISDAPIIRIDFSGVSMLFPCGVIVLYSTLQRAARSGKQLKLIGYQKNNRAHQVLQQIGVLDLVGTDLPKTKIDRGDVECWHMQTIETGDSDRGARYKEFLNAATEAKGMPELSNKFTRKLYGAIDEAVMNMQEHAYDSASEALGWILCSYQDGRFGIWAYDDGIGIPASIKLHPRIKEMHLKPLGAIAPETADSTWIERAVELSRTSTQEFNRGRGLPQIVNCALENEGSVTIMSGSGQYFQAASNVSQEDREQPIRRLAGKLPGTIISWNFKLNE